MNGEARGGFLHFFYELLGFEPEPHSTNIIEENPIRFKKRYVGIVRSLKFNKNLIFFSRDVKI